LVELTNFDYKGDGQVFCFGGSERKIRKSTLYRMAREGKIPAMKIAN